MAVRQGNDRRVKLRFSSFEVDLDAGELRKNGLRFKLPDQAFEVLAVLLKRAGEVVTREELQQALWPADTLVDSDHGLNKAINRIREALGDSASTPRFLETLPRRGYRFIGGVEEITQSPVEPPLPAMNGALGLTTPASRAQRGRTYIWWAVGVLLIALAVVTLSSLLLHRRDETALSTRSSILIDSAGALGMWDLSVSPDGKWLAFNARSGQVPNPVSGLWLRRLDSLAARPIAAEGRAFWSPDSRYIAFWDYQTLKKMEATGGHPVVVTNFGADRGGTWSQFDVILFAGFNPGPIYRVPAKGGTPEAVTKVERSRGEIGHSWPFFLPDGQHFLYSARVSVDGENNETNTIRVASLDGRTNKFLLYADSNATYSQGYLLFARNHRLMAQPFDTATLSTTRDAVSIAEPIVMWEDHGDFDASSNGALVYRTGADFGSRLVWLDRNGTEVGSVADASRFYRPRISPDGRTIAVDAMNDGKVNRDLWIYPVRGGTGTRLTSDHLIHTHPIWSPDGRRIASAASAPELNDRDLFVRNADVDRHDELLLNMPGDKTPSDWSPDGRFIAYQFRGPKRTTLSLWILPLFGSRKPFEFRPSAFESKEGQFSPDGHWIAYTSDESGKEEVYVARFPEGGNTQKVSVNGGSEPRWRSDERELFYLSSDSKLMTTDVQAAGATLRFENLHGLFDCLPTHVTIGTVYDVSADGQRFVVSTRTNTAWPPAVLITNWRAGLPH